MLGHYLRKCQFPLVLARGASGVQVSKEAGEQRETLCPNKNPLSPSKCRFFWSKFPKAHSCNVILTSINGPCLCCFSQSLDTRRWSQASQVLSLSSTFSLPDLPTAPDGLASPSLSFPEGVGERKELEKRQEASICQYQPWLSHTIHPVGQVWNRPWVGKWLKLGPLPMLPCLPTFLGRKYHPLPAHLRLSVLVGALNTFSPHWYKWWSMHRSNALLYHWGDHINESICGENLEETSCFWSHLFIHPLSKSLLRTYNTPGNILDTGDRVLNFCGILFL